MNYPYFVGVGFPKCGTSFLYREICKHPKIDKYTKERHFFSKPFYKFSDNEIKTYLNKFDSDKIVGEFSPGILYYPLNIKFLYKALKDKPTKLIVIIRNPIDRVHSHFKQLKKFRLKNINPQNAELFVKNSLYPEVIYSGLYYLQLNKLFRYFSKNRVIIVQYEKLCDNFIFEMKNLFRFLSVEEIELKNNTHAPTIYGGFRDELKEYYEDDVRKLFDEYSSINRYSHIDKSLWSDF